MWLTGKHAEAVLNATRAWQDARRAVIGGGIERFEQDKKGDMVPVPNHQAWKDLSDAETALSEAIDKHRSVDA